jgi:hypothetical protein
VAYEAWILPVGKASAKSTMVSKDIGNDDQPRLGFVNLRAAYFRCSPNLAYRGPPGQEGRRALQFRDDAPRAGLHYMMRIVQGQPLESQPLLWAVSNIPKYAASQNSRL